MLFVGHHQIQVLECDSLRNDRVRADYQVRASGSGLLKQDPSGFSLDGPGQEPDSDAERFQERSERLRMLLRKYLSRRHDRALMTVLPCEVHRCCGDCGLAASDVPLQQAVHCLVPAEIGSDLAYASLLCPCEFERERLNELIGRDIAVSGLIPMYLALSELYAQREHQQFFKYQSFPGFGRIGLAFGKMYLPECFFRSYEAVFPAYVLRQTFGHCEILLLKDLPYVGGDHPGGQPFRQRILRRQYSGLALLDQNGIHHAHSEKVLLDLSVEDVLVSGLKSGAGVRIIEVCQFY